MILVVGANGMLGHDLMEVFGGDARGMDLPELDITDPMSVRKALLTLRPRVVINAAAYTDVDGCETNKEIAMEVNGEGVAFLSMIAAEIGATLVQISTDYVFDGTKGSPYVEDDFPHPLSVYGESKMVGEMNTSAAPEHLVVRTQWLYGRHGKNFVETMLRLAGEKDELAVVNDQVGAPTWTMDLSKAIKALLDNGCRGIYHMANSGSCSWFEFAEAIFEEAGVTARVRPISTAELGRPAPRPAYSTLDCSRLVRDTGFTPQPWREALKHYLRQRSIA
jgi:dTDP-4-dehydrorhamnose reductase